MPIFNKKPHHKPPPPRTGRIAESLCPRVIKPTDPVTDIRLDLLNEKELRFVDGIWIQHSAKGNGRTAELNVDDLVKLKGKMDRLEQENNLLQLKVDILTDLMTQQLCMDEANKS